MEADTVDAGVATMESAEIDWKRLSLDPEA